MILEFKNEDKVNLEELRNELKVDFKVIETPRTETRIDNQVIFFGYKLEINDTGLSQADKEKIMNAAKKHKPLKSTAEIDKEKRDSEKLLRDAANLKPILTSLIESDAAFLAYLRQKINV